MGGCRNHSEPITFVLPDVISGMILSWSGAVGAIPGGFVLCDGNNGTPNLLGKSIIGAGGAFAVSDNGGDTSHDHPDTFSLGDPDSTDAAGAGSDVDLATDTHAHPVNGSVSAKTTRSPYYALCFIMKT